jgi:hypothetical protein
VHPTKGEPIMSIKNRKGQILLSGIILVAMLLCVFFALPQRSRHSGIWHLIFYGFLLLNSFILYKRNAKNAVPDTLIRLFPKANQEISGETISL